MKKSARKKYLLELPLYIVGLYIVFWLSDKFVLNEMEECITNTWCINSKQDPFIYPLFQTLGLFLIIGTVILTYMLCLRMLASKYARFFFGGVILLVSAMGIFAYFGTVEPKDRMEYIFIPILSGFFLLLGLMITFGKTFRKKKTKKKK